MSEINKASEFAGKLATEASRFSTAAIWLAGLVAMFTLFAFVASLLAARKSGELVAAKDTWLALVLKDKDEQIATSQAAGEAAKSDAAKANLEAARANASAATANEQAERARESAAKANEGLAKANLQIEDRKKENSVLKERTDAAETARLAMEKSLEETRKQTIESLELANRVELATFVEKMERDFEAKITLPRKLSDPRRGQYFAALNELKGTRFAVVTLSEAEPRRTGKMIDEFLEHCGWVRAESLSSFNETDEFDFGEGITIEGGEVGALYKTQLFSAVEMLDSVLRDSEIQAITSFREETRPNSLPNDVVRIVVGTKPNWAMDIKRWKDDISKRQRDEITRRSQQSRENIDGWKKHGKIPNGEGLGRMSHEAWRIIAEAKPPEGYGALAIGSLSSSPPAIADPLADALEAAGWIVDREEYRGGKVDGVLVSVRKDASEATVAASKQLQGLLRKAGIPVAFESCEDPKRESPFVAFVGPYKE